ncbi:MAG: polysaccharide deacetylase family protein [Myxococcota bacterium]|nr:polysaccharide deacetylase family protein [Myxococcota bacterium]
MSVRAVALTIDMDGVAEYARLHGIARPSADPLLMYRAPLARFAALCDSLGALGTVYAIGRDVEAGAGELLTPLVARGFEVGAHSFAHDYAMADRDVPFVYDDVSRVRRAIEIAVGRAPSGFRAPGYLLSTTILDALEALGFDYDSSVLPSPSYYALKLTVLAGYRAIGRDFGSSWKTPRLGLAPTQPYRPSVKPYERGNRKLIELPIAVTTAARLPLTAAAMVLAPRALRRFMMRSLAPRDVVIVNFHAMDLADPSVDEIPPELVRYQPELRIAVDERLERLRESLAGLLRDRAPMTCATIARAFV